MPLKIYVLKKRTVLLEVNVPMLNIFTSRIYTLEKQNYESLTVPSGTRMALTAPWGLLSAS